MTKIPKPARKLFLKDRDFRYDPKPGITTWELAQFIAVLVEDKPMHFERFFTIIPETMQRHFRHTKNG